MSNLKDTYGKQWSDDPALLKKLLDAGETILFLAAGDSDTLRCRQVEDIYRFGQYDLAKDKLCAKFLTKWGIQFLLPAPSVEPAPLEWHHYEDGSALSSSGDWSFYADDTEWIIRLRGKVIDYGSLTYCGIETSIAAIQEWWVSHFNSMIKK